MTATYPEAGTGHEHRAHASFRAGFPLELLGVRPSTVSLRVSSIGANPLHAAPDKSC